MTHLEATWNCAASFGCAPVRSACQETRASRGQRARARTHAQARDGLKIRVSPVRIGARPPSLNNLQQHSRRSFESTWNWCAT